MNKEASIRVVQLSDAPQLLRIYRPYVLHSTVTPEFDVPSLKEFKERIEITKAQYPFLVYCFNKEILGYAYAHKYRQAAGHQWSAEVSIYLANNMQGKGIASLLYDTLFSILKYQGLENVFAGIILPNPRSVFFHQKAGFKAVGTFKKGIYKGDHWYDVRWMQYALNRHLEHPVAPTPFKTLERSVVLRDILNTANSKLH